MGKVGLDYLDYFSPQFTSHTPLSGLNKGELSLPQFELVNISIRHSRTCSKQVGQNPTPYCLLYFYVL